jgi:hypothetical protein
MNGSNTITLMDFRHGQVVEIDESIPPIGAPAERDAEAPTKSAGGGVVFGSIGSPPPRARLTCASRGQSPASAYACTTLASSR